MVKIVESTQQRLVLQSGSTVLTLDKTAGTAVFQRKMMFWSLKPMERPLADVSGATLDTVVDRASGVEVCHAMLLMRTGDGWAMPANDKKDGQAAVDAIRSFIGSAA